MGKPVGGDGKEGWARGKEGVEQVKGLAGEGIEFGGKRVVAGVFGRARRPSRTTGQMLRKHDPDLCIEVGVGASLAPRQFSCHEIDSGLGHATRIRDDVVFMLKSLAQLTQFGQ